MAAEYELRDRLVNAVAVRLEPHGWQRLCENGGRGVVSLSSRPLSQEIALIASMRCPVGTSFPIFGRRRAADRPPEPFHVSEISVQVAYAPLARLYPLLGGSSDGLVELPAVHGAADDDAVDDRTESLDEGDDEGDERPYAQPISDAEEIPAVVAAIVAEIVAQTEPIDQWPLTNDALIARLGGSVAHKHRNLRLAAVLAAAGRLEDAARELDLPNWEHDREHPWDRDAGTRRVSWQLRRWIRGGGDPSLLPSAPPPAKRAQREVRTWSEMQAKNRPRREAIKAVRAKSDGKSRAELRTLLDGELAARGLTMRPIATEKTLDHLNSTPLDYLAPGLGLFGKAAKQSGWVIKALREGEFVGRLTDRVPDMTPPRWLTPPENAVYEFPVGEEWSEVVLADDIRAWLDESVAELPPLFGIRQLSAWCRPESTKDSEPAALAVYLGDKRVGVVPDASATAFADVLSDASFREELLVLEAALLTQETEPRYIFEVGLPARTA
jgi:hypothetical protein